MVAQFPSESSTADSNSRLDWLYPEITSNFRVNHVSNPHKTVDISLKISNIKIDEINETLDRITTYVKQAIAADLNPTVNVSEAGNIIFP
jgi:hypothetical protein